MQQKECETVLENTSAKRKKLPIHTEILYFLLEFLCKPLTLAGSSVQRLAVTYRLEKFNCTLFKISLINKP